jgi:adenosylcobinamide-GDP ribazoletransferase
VQFIRHFLLAIQFFTRIPVHGRLGAWVGFSPAMLRASAAHFPGVGWIVAAVAGAVFAGFMAALPHTLASPWVAAIACTVASVWLTGGFHEDGLADTADGLGGHVSRERALEIMKDSRIGAYGAMALVLALLTKVSLLALLGEVDPMMALTAVVCAHVFSRFLPLVLIRVLPHVGDAAGSKSKPLADQISWSALSVAVLWCVPAFALSLWMVPGLTLVAGWLGAVMACIWIARLLAMRLQGFTGDGLGATQQLSEIAFYLGVALTL